MDLTYLWIDSFCIVQNDREDWQLESAKIASIYENSTMTIAATKSSESTQGCFTELDPKFRDYELPSLHSKGKLDH
jgi:hypothetical protein